MYETRPAAVTALAHPDLYPDGVTVSAHDVAAALRERLPGLGTKKLHKLLYYCQGHHLAAFGRPLFSEPVSAWDMGPVVGTLWRHEKDGEAPPVPATLTEAELNTIGYVVSRYGKLSGRDLELLTHSETPWQLADRSRPREGSARIERQWMWEYFQADRAGDGDEEEAVSLDQDEVDRWLQDAAQRRTRPVKVDTMEELRARLTPGG